MLKMPDLKLKVFHQGLIIVGVPFLIELIIIGNLWMLLIQSDKERSRENRYRQYTAMGARMMALTYDGPYMLFNYLQSGDRRLLKVYEKDIALVRHLKAESKKIASNDPIVEDASNEIAESLETFLSLTDQVAASSKGGAMGLLSELPNLQARFNNAKDLAIERLAVMIRIGQRSTQETERRIQHVRNLQAGILSFGLFANLGVAVLLLLFYKRKIMKRLGTISTNTLRISQAETLEKALAGHDEIAMLDKAFHSMDRQLKEASERERNLFNNASDVICVLDENYKFIKINPASRRLWHYEPEALLNRDIFYLLPDFETEKLKDALARCKSSHEASLIELTIKVGKEQTLETIWSAYWSETERSLFCVVHDISERKESERIKQEFLSMISSDLKRPLSRISEQVNTLLCLKAGGLPAQAIEKLSVVQKNVSRLLLLVNDLLQISELESGKLELSKEDCSIEELIKRSILDVESLAEKQRIKIDYKVDANKCFVDPNRIMQVLVNLLSNAVKFSPEEGRIELSAGREGDYIEVKIKDQGRGVPASHRQTIFEKFKQVEAADGKRQAGTGLGLPICKQIIEEHGGTIGVESEEAKGSTFWFRVPVDESASMKIKALRQQESSHKDSAGRSEP
ncbi:MAG: cell wall metabolism sensor histidine kinase WalK, partial [Candidatus Obscuribacterales bacterium]|nr:cell wall metabolism sensor histidine kinase WalK [Candidatus Obscuribacterales bacterium]